MMMDEQTRLDALKFLAERHRGQFDERRKLEYKTLFAALSFYVVTVGGILAKNLTIPQTPKLWAWLGYFMFALATSLYLANIHMANNRNKTIAENAENAMVAIIRGDKADLDLFSFTRHWVSWRTLRSGSSTWTWLWQMLILFLFAIAGATLIRFSG